MRSKWTSILALTLIVVLAAGCGDASGRRSGAAAGGPAATSLERMADPVSPEPVPLYEGNPGDILTLSNLGISENILHYETYDQMRDFSDSVVLARFDRFEVAAEPSADATLSGASLLFSMSLR